MRTIQRPTAFPWGSTVAEEDKWSEVWTLCPTRVGRFRSLPAANPPCREPFLPSGRRSLESSRRAFLSRISPPALPVAGSGAASLDGLGEGDRPLPVLLFAAFAKHRAVLRRDAGGQVPGKRARPIARSLKPPTIWFAVSGSGP